MRNADLIAIQTNYKGRVFSRTGFNVILKRHIR